MNLKAYKMDGLGNDFVIFDNRKKITQLNKNEIIKIADRNFIGCDQLIFINKSNDYDAELDFYNSDGGNGKRGARKGRYRSERNPSQAFTMIAPRTRLPPINVCIGGCSLSTYHTHKGPNTVSSSMIRLTSAAEISFGP